MKGNRGQHIFQEHVVSKITPVLMDTGKSIWPKFCCCVDPSVYGRVEIKGDTGMLTKHLDKKIIKCLDDKPRRECSFWEALANLECTGDIIPD